MEPEVNEIAKLNDQHERAVREHDRSTVRLLNEAIALRSGADGDEPLPFEAIVTVIAPFTTLTAAALHELAWKRHREAGRRRRWEMRHGRASTPLSDWPSLSEGAGNAPPTPSGARTASLRDAARDYAKTDAACRSVLVAIRQAVATGALRGALGSELAGLLPSVPQEFIQAVARGARAR